MIDRSMGRTAGTLVAFLLIAGAVLPLGEGAAAATIAGGEKKWIARYDGPSNGADAASSVARSPDGSKVFGTGASEGVGTGEDYATIAYDAATGSVQWATRYNGPADDRDSASSIAASPDGTKVFVTGFSYNGEGRFYRDYATIAYDAATGGVLWAKRYGPGNYDTALSLAASPDGSKVFVTGYSDGNGTIDYVTIAYGVATGAVRWTKRYHGPANGGDYATSIAASPDGSKVFVTGDSAGAGAGYDYATIAYDAASGAVLWTERYDGPNSGDDHARSIASSPDGSSVFVTGQSIGTGTANDYATIAYDAVTGAVLWTRRYDGAGHGDDYGMSIAASPDGSKVFVTGFATGADTLNDYATIAYDAVTGAVLWTRRYGPRKSYSSAFSVATSPDGTKVFVTGGSQHAGGATSFYATIAYDAASGTTMWSRRYKGPDPGHSAAIALSASPDSSRVFVTGSSFGDYATIAYAA